MRYICYPSPDYDLAASVVADKPETATQIYARAYLIDPLEITAVEPALIPLTVKRQLPAHMPRI